MLKSYGKSIIICSGSLYLEFCDYRIDITIMYTLKYLDVLDSLAIKMPGPNVQDFVGTTAMQIPNILDVFLFIT